MRRALGQEPARLRHAAGLSQRQFAPLRYVLLFIALLCYYVLAAKYSGRGGGVQARLYGPLTAVWGCFGWRTA
jgi:hypothetical protein